MDVVFNEPWMDRINPALLVRFWKSKGCPGVLYTREYGLKIANFNTPAGVLAMAWGGVRSLGRAYTKLGDMSL